MAHSSKPTFALITLGMWTGGFLAFVLAFLYVVFTDLLTLAMAGAV
ncbi:putative membrane protein [Halorubrum sp. AJ67]|nr:putative membrane protein [Halorubrum sp. AJ67]